MSDYAWTRYTITTQDSEHVDVLMETNDDLDYGFPTEFSRLDMEFTGPDALAQAKKHTGVSRQGIGHRVFVTLDGEAI